MCATSITIRAVNRPFTCGFMHYGAAPRANIKPICENQYLESSKYSANSLDSVSSRVAINELWGSFTTTRMRNLFSKKSERAGRLSSKAARRRAILKVLLYAREYFTTVPCRARYPYSYVSFDAPPRLHTTAVQSQAPWSGISHPKARRSLLSRIYTASHAQITPAHHAPSPTS